MGVISNEPRDHHYVPQFYLRNFAVDSNKLKIWTAGKSGPVVVWDQRSIASVGHEPNFYVHMEGGVPVSVETFISYQMENPISKSLTWQKICRNPQALDRSDRPVLYALIRHLLMRTPHALSTHIELAAMAAGKNSPIPFSEEEIEMYAEVAAIPDGSKALLNALSIDTAWETREIASCAIMVLHSEIELCTSTTPVMQVRIPANPRLSLPLPGLTPHMDVLPLTPNLMVTLARGDFDGAFSVVRIDEPTARGFNRQRLIQFANSEQTRHLITGIEHLVEDMVWARYHPLPDSSDEKIVFRRKATC